MTKIFRCQCDHGLLNTTYSKRATMRAFPLFFSRSRLCLLFQLEVPVAMRCLMQVERRRTFRFGPSCCQRISTCSSLRLRLSTDCATATAPAWTLLPEQMPLLIFSKLALSSTFCQPLAAHVFALNVALTPFRTVAMLPWAVALFGCPITAIWSWVPLHSFETLLQLP